MTDQADVSGDVVLLEVGRWGGGFIARFYSARMGGVKPVNSA